jgi:outer membrane receptor for ferric coprogen and ferric-rhodotorulic acid
MKTQTRLLLVLAILAPSCALAQSAPASAKTAEASDAVVLSPFVVQTENDEGYRASMTTAGSRLKTDLKDVAASVTVLTNDFMNDLGANDVASALAFVAGAENDSTYHQEGLTFSGANNYVGGDFGDNNNRSGEVRVRGLGRASTTINYFDIVGSTDRYNTDRTEFLRGPNSILFGLAEPAGLINSTTKSARLNRTGSTVETKIDNLGSNRLVLDHNQVLIKNRLALRVVGLYNDQQYDVKTAFLKDKRLFLTGTYTPFSGTTIRAYYEAQNTYSRRPNFRTVQDNVSDWLRAYNTYAPQMTPSQIASAFYWDPTVRSGNGAPTATSFTLANGSTVNLGLIRRSLDTTAAGTALIYSPGQWINPLDNRVVTLSTRNNTAAGANANPNGAFNRSGSPLENTVGFLDPQVTNSGIFPYKSVEIGALPGNYRTENDHKFYVNLEQRITPDLYVSAAVQHEDWQEEQYFANISQDNQISIDINSKLADGRTNPNFLRPFLYGRNLGENINTKEDNLVVQGNYDFDFAKKTSSLGWLGHHRFTAVHTRSKQDRIRYQYNNQFDSDIPGVLPQTIAGNSSARFNMQLWYVGDPVQVGDTSLRYTGFPSTLSAQAGRSYDYQYFDAATGTFKFSPTQIHVDRYLVTNGRTYTINKNNGTGLSLQSFYWKDKIVTLFGWRRDNVDNVQRSLINTAVVAPFPTLLGASRADYLGTGSRFTFGKDTTTQSIVYKALSWARVFANQSENFAASSQRQDNLYRPVPPQSGETREFGAGFTFFENKLDVKITHFATSQKYAASGVFGQVPNNRITAFEGRLYNALVGLGRGSEWTTIGEFGQPSTAPYVTPNGTTATGTSESTGTGLELSYAPTRSLDIVFSVDKIDNKITSVGPELADFFAARASFYRKYFNEGIITNGTSNAAQDFATNVAAEYTAGSAFIGTSNRGVADYTSTMVARYKFLEGSIKGLTIGTNLRWESGKVNGYRLKPTTFNFGGLDNYAGQTYDTTNPFVGDPILTGGMQLSYRRKIFSGRVGWKIQLNAQNFFSKTGLRVIGSNSDGSAVYGLAPARTYELSNSFEF